MQGKVHIFWEGHNILQNLHLTFVCMYCRQKWRLHKILWPSQNIRSLTRCHWKSFNKYVWNSGRIPVRKANGVRFYFQSKWRLSFDAIFAFIPRIGHSKNIALALLHYCGSQYYRSLTWNVVVISAFFDCLQFDKISSSWIWVFKSTFCLWFWFSVCEVSCSNHFHYFFEYFHNVCIFYTL